MGFRFRKSVTIMPGLRVNLSKSGASLTAGARGASVSVGPRGTYANIGVPGTGVSYRTRLDKTGTQHKTGTQRAMASSGVPTASRRSSPMLHLLGILVLGVFGGFVWLNNSDPLAEAPGLPTESQVEIAVNPLPNSALTAHSRTATAQTNLNESKDSILALQEALLRLGFDPGPVDGVPGQKTVNAIKLFQLTQGQRATGTIDDRLVKDVTESVRAQTTATPR